MSYYDQYDQESQALLHGIKPLSFDDIMGNSRQNSLNNLARNTSSDYLSPFAKQFEFKSLTSKEIAENYFNNIKPVQKSNITVYQEPETKTDVILKEINIYRDNNTSKGFQQEGDVLLYKVLAYISKSQTKLKDLYLKTEDKVADNEILLFLEDNAEDSSEQYLYARFGKAVKKEHLLSAEQQENLLKLVPDFNAEMLKELIQTGQVKAKNTFTSAVAKALMYIASLIGLPGKAIGWLCNEVGEAISKYLTIPDSIWDSKGQDYFLSKENVVKGLQIDTSLINTLTNSLKSQEQYQWFNGFLVPEKAAQFLEQPITTLQDVVNRYNNEIAEILDSIYSKDGNKNYSHLYSLPITEVIAFLCGLWNGLVDFVAGTFKFLAMALSLQFDITTNFNDIMEEVDELYNNLKKIKFTDVLIPAVATYFQILDEINEFFTSKNRSEEYNFDKIAYFIGFGLAFVATAFIPFTQLVKISGITKISKLIPEEFLTSLSQVKGKTINGIKPMLALFREMSGVLAKGTDEIMAFFQRIKKAIVEWFKKNKKVFKQIYKKLPKSRKPTSLDIEKLSKVRKVFNAGRSKNVAFTEGKIGGKKIDLKSRSGEPKGTPENFDNFQQISPENYHYKNGPLNRQYDSEQKQIEYIYQMFKQDKKIKGKIEIVSDLKICDNCNDIIKRFQNDFPNIVITKVWVKNKL